MTVQKPLLPDELSNKTDKFNFEVSKCEVTRTKLPRPLKANYEAWRPFRVKSKAAQ